MDKRLKRLWIDEDVHRILKVEAANEGKPIKDYLRSLVVDNGKTLEFFKKDNKKKGGFKGVF